MRQFFFTWLFEIQTHEIRVLYILFSKCLWSKWPSNNSERQTEINERLYLAFY
jgi:hypothetical protein